jgi:predicted transposase/invertase (TIGR01784 family)
LDEWIYFLKNEEIKENFKAKGLKKAQQELDILRLPEKERLAYARYQNDLHYQASMVESSYTFGREEGIKVGKEEGRHAQKIEIATNLLHAGILDTNTIANITGLTLAEVRKLNAAPQ